MIAENADISQGVFDLTVTLNDFVDPESKSNDPDVVDIVVTAALKRIRCWIWIFFCLAVWFRQYPSNPFYPCINFGECGLIIFTSENFSLLK